MDAITRIKLQKQPKKDFLKETLGNVQAQINPPELKGITVIPSTAQAEAIEQNKQNIADINYNQRKNGNQALTPELASEILSREGTMGLWNAINKDSAYEGQDAIDNRYKKEKQRALITSIADGLSSIANIGGTLAGGVSQKQSSLSEANMKRREYQRQLRNKDREKWQQMMLRTGENQQNYELARKRQEIQYQDNLLQHQYNQQRIDLEKLTQMRLMAESNKKADYYDAMIKTKQAQIDKTMSDIENNRARTNSYIYTNETRANASQTSANASALRASSTATKNEAEIKGRKEGWWNKNDKSSGNEPTPSKYMPGTEDKPKPTAAPKKQAATKSQPTKTTNTSSLGEYGYKSNNKKHQKNPFE